MIYVVQVIVVKAAGTMHEVQKQLMSCKKKHLCLSEFCCLYSGRFQAHALPEDLQKFNMVSAYNVRHMR